MSNGEKSIQEHQLLTITRTRFMPFVQWWKSNLESGNIQELKRHVKEVSTVVEDFASTFV
jgi:hypothetical protein